MAHSRERFSREDFSLQITRADLCSVSIRRNEDRGDLGSEIAVQEILLCLVEDIVQTVRRRYEARLPQAKGVPLEELFAFIDAHVALGDDASPAMVASWVTIAAEAVHQEEVRALYSNAIQTRVDELRRLITSVLKSEGGSARGAKDMASALAAAIEGSFQIAAAAPGAIPPGSAAKSLRAMATGLLSGAAA